MNPVQIDVVCRTPVPIYPFRGASEHLEYPVVLWPAGAGRARSRPEQLPESRSLLYLKTSELYAGAGMMCLQPDVSRALPLWPS